MSKLRKFDEYVEEERLRKKERLRKRDGDGDGVLPNGGVVRVPMMMRDSATNATMRVHDGRGGPAGHRPGFVYATDVESGHNIALRTIAADVFTSGARTMDARQQAHAEYVRELTNAWRTDSQRQQRAGDACTINGAPGTLVETRPGVFECRPAARADAVPSRGTIRDARAIAREERDEELRNAWRKPA